MKARTLTCGCVTHSTSMRGMWGFYCETEGQGYCNFECPHELEAFERLEEIRASIVAESVSYGELADLADLAAYITPGDVQLLEWAGEPEFGYPPRILEMERADNGELRRTRYEVSVSMRSELFTYDESGTGDHVRTYPSEAARDLAVSDALHYMWKEIQA